MKSLAALLGVAVIALMATACNKPADTHDADVQAIKDTEAQWNRDWQAKATDKIAEHYADDAMQITPGMAPIQGKEAIAGALKQMTADPAIALTFKPSRVEVAKSGDLAYTEGSYQLTVTDPVSKQVVHDHGNYVTTYRKAADGTWKAVLDITASEVPPPAPPPVKTKKH